ncbi:MAG TPA: DUF429 domain-containing protein [Acidobacteria bacterium]|nr:DUF429 domain-containing protein [Acidobacteriota bacterium]
MSSQFIKIAGIDLAGSPRRPTGFCLIDGKQVFLKVLFTDEEIVEEVLAARPELVTVDAPLSLPPGRQTINERNAFHFRPCDLELRKRGLKFFPITLGPMRMLTERGLRLKYRLEKVGLRVIEVYPGGAQDIWRLPRARQNRAKLQAGLLKRLSQDFGLNLARPRKSKKSFSPDELDALTAALVGLLCLQGRAEIYGREPWIIVMPGNI